MKVISDDIKKGEFKSVYLLYGEEEYLKKVLQETVMNYEKDEEKDLERRLTVGRKRAMQT